MFTFYIYLVVLRGAKQVTLRLWGGLSVLYAVCASTVRPRI